MKHRHVIIQCLSKYFIAESLATHLRHAAIDYLVEYADRNKHNPAEYDNEALHEAADHANILAQELHNRIWLTHNWGTTRRASMTKKKRNIFLNN